MRGGRGLRSGTYLHCIRPSVNSGTLLCRQAFRLGLISTKVYTHELYENSTSFARPMFNNILVAF